MLWSPVCTLALTPYIDCLPSMQADMAMPLFSDVDPLYVAPFISEPSQLFPLASGLSCSDTHGVSLLAQVLRSLLGLAISPQEVFCKAANPYLTPPCGVHPLLPSAPWGKDDHH